MKSPINTPASITGTDLHEVGAVATFDAKRESPTPDRVLTLIATLCALMVINWVPLFGDWTVGPYTAIITLSDVFLGVLFLVSIKTIPAMLRESRSPIANIGAVFVFINLVVFGIHPSGRGAQVMLQLLGGLSIMWLVTSGRVRITTLIKSLTCVSAVEAVLCGWAWSNGSALGLWFLGEPSKPYWDVDGSLAPTGTFIHPYAVAGLGVIVAGMCLAFGGTRRLSFGWAAVGTAAGATNIALSLSRSAALAFVAIACSAVLLAWFSRERRSMVLLAIFAVVGIGLGAARLNDGWLHRVTTSTINSSNADSGRTELMNQAIRMGRENPLGVGPGRYNLALREQFVRENPGASTDHLLLVHNLPLTLFAETGGLSVLVFLAMSVAVLRHAKRAGLAGMVLVVAPISLIMTDLCYWLFTGGIMFLSMWISAVAVLAQTPKLQTVQLAGLGHVPSASSGSPLGSNAVEEHGVNAQNGELVTQ
jgi:hypothetical protein